MRERHFFGLLVDEVVDEGGNVRDPVAQGGMEMGKTRMRK
jgi:hypothetical protein